MVGEPSTELGPRDDISMTLAEIARIIGACLDPEEAMERCSRYIRRVLPFDRLDLNVIDISSRFATRIYAEGCPVRGWRVGDTRPFGTVAEKSLLRREPIVRREGEIYGDDGREPFHQDAPCEAGLLSMLAVPLVIRGEAVGELVFRSKQRNSYGPGQWEIAVSISRFVSGLMHNVQLRRLSELRAREQDFLARLDEAALRHGTTEEFLRFACHAAWGELFPIDCIELDLEHLDLSGNIIQTHYAESLSHGGTRGGRCRSGQSDPADSASGNMLVADTHNLNPALSGHAARMTRRDAEGHYWVSRYFQPMDSIAGWTRLHWIGNEHAFGQSEHTIDQIAKGIFDGIRRQHWAERASSSSMMQYAFQSIIQRLAPHVSMGQFLRGFEDAVAEVAAVQCYVLLDSLSDPQVGDDEWRVVRSRCRHIPVESHGATAIDKLTAGRSLETTAELEPPAASSGRPFGGAPLLLHHERIVRCNVPGSNVRAAYFIFEAPLASERHAREFDVQVSAWLKTLAVIDPTSSMVQGENHMMAAGRTADPLSAWQDGDLVTPTLTADESAILSSVALGLSNEEIGDQLHVSSGTVKNRLGVVYRKLGVGTRAAAVTVGLRRGLISDVTSGLDHHDMDVGTAATPR